MKVHLIKELCQEFVQSLSDQQSFKYAYLWEALMNYKSKWDIDAVDFVEMYTSGFSSAISNRLWRREDYYPFDNLKLCMQTDPSFTRSMFKDLINEKKDLNMRVNRFLLYCDQLLQIMQRNGSNISTHYHDDRQMIMTYLSFEYPEKYTLYNQTGYIKALKRIGATKIPVAHDPQQFLIFTKVISKYLNETEGFEEISKVVLKDSGIDNYPESLLWTFVFYTYITNVVL